MYSTQNKQLNTVTSHQVTRLFTHDASEFLIRSRDKVDKMVVDEVGNKISRVDGQVC